MTVADAIRTIDLKDSRDSERIDGYMLAKIEESSEEDWVTSAQRALSKNMFVLLVPAAFLRPNTLVPGVNPMETEVREIGDLTILSASHQVLAGRQPLPLSHQEFLLLETLTTPPIKLWPFQELLKVVWGYRCWRDAGPVRSAVKRLRKKLDQADAGVVIESARGVGFRVSVTLAGLGSHSSTA